MKTLEKKKIIIITGSSAGIGFGLAKSFLQDNNKIIICSNNLDRLKKSSKKLNNCYYLRIDLANKTLIKKSINKIKKKFKKIDILICNYGDSDFKKNNLDFEYAFNNNFFSTVNTIKYFTPVIKNDTGKIICISSICGIESIKNAPIGYSLAKAALNNYVKMISVELAKKNILINAIAPGNILFKGSTWEKKLKKNKLKIKKYIQENVPLKKFGTIQEIFSLCKHLCYDQNFSTGATYILDGGQTRRF